MREYDITPDEITTAYNKKLVRSPARKTPAPTATKRKVPIKSRHPDTGETWTGRGKAPRWITGIEAEGKKREDFLIEP
jgi:DNA-binding protein H-NS